MLIQRKWPDIRYSEPRLGFQGVGKWRCLIPMTLKMVQPNWVVLSGIREGWGVKVLAKESFEINE